MGQVAMPQPICVVPAQTTAQGFEGLGSAGPGARYAGAWAETKPSKKPQLCNTSTFAVAFCEGKAVITGPGRPVRALPPGQTYAA